MNTTLVDKIVNAVLYEGYLLYPYRRSMKTQRRWTFGCVYPRASAEANNSEPWTMQTQFLIEGNEQTKIEGDLRFLHLTQRRVARAEVDCDVLAKDAKLEYVDTLEIDGVAHESWQEAAERRIQIDLQRLGDLNGKPACVRFGFPAHREAERLSDSPTSCAVVVREQLPLEGRAELSAAQVTEGLFAVTARILNTSTPIAAASACSAGDDPRQMQSFVSTHAIFAVHGGQLVSMIDPPEHCRKFAGQLHNEGTWPVLVGQPGERDMMLSSPIILYDYPQVAAESPGDLFDSTEIDEILALRIMTLTDDEKRQMRCLDARARAILARTETLPEDHWMKLHGAIRGLKRVAPVTSGTP